MHFSWLKIAFKNQKYYIFITPKLENLEKQEKKKRKVKAHPWFKYVGKIMWYFGIYPSRNFFNA